MFDSFIKSLDCFSSPRLLGPVLKYPHPKWHTVSLISTVARSSYIGQVFYDQTMYLYVCFSGFFLEKVTILCSILLDKLGYLLRILL